MELDRRDRVVGDVSSDGLAERLGECLLGDEGLSERRLGERLGDTDGRRKCNGTAVGEPSKRDRPCWEGDVGRLRDANGSSIALIDAGGEAERLRLLVRLDTGNGSSSIWTGDRGR